MRSWSRVRRYADCAARTGEQDPRTEMSSSSFGQWMPTLTEIGYRGDALFLGDDQRLEQLAALACAAVVGANHRSQLAFQTRQPLLAHDLVWDATCSSPADNPCKDLRREHVQDDRSLPGSPSELG
jgi:hypothetical protein